MEESRREDEPRSIRYLQTTNTRYTSSRDDEAWGNCRSTVDLTDSGWAPNPLSGPSTNRADAAEARAMNMIAGFADSRATDIPQRAGGIGKNAQGRLSKLVSLGNGSAKQRQGKTKADLKGRARVRDQSDGSIVVVTIQDKAGSDLASPAQDSSGYQVQGEISTPEQRAESFKAKVTTSSDIPKLGLTQFFFEHETDLLAVGQGAVGRGPLTLAIPYQPTVPAEDGPALDHAQIQNNAQQLDTDTACSSIPDDEISLFELPPPQYKLYEQGEYQAWSLNEGFFSPDDEVVVEASSSRLAESLILSINTPVSSSLGASQALTNDWRYLEQDDGVLGSGSPPASLMVEETDSLMEEPVDLGSARNTPLSSRRNSISSSGAELSHSDCVLPTIYPGMEQYPSANNCAGEANEDWSNTSRSLFDPTPQYHHRVVSTPVHLRGGGEAKKDPNRFTAWRLFLGKKPIGDAEKGQLLLDSPVGIMDNFLLGRRGQPKTGRELCEETERRIEKGKELHRLKEEKRNGKKAVK